MRVLEMTHHEAQLWLEAQGFKRAESSRWWWFPPAHRGTSILVRLYSMTVWQVQVVGPIPRVYNPLTDFNPGSRAIHWEFISPVANDFTELPQAVHHALVAYDQALEKGLNGLSAWGARTHDSYFTGTADILESIESSSGPPFDPSDEDERDERWRSVIHGSRTVWAAKPHHMVQVEASKILFMEGNLWNFEHAAAILQFIKDGQPSMSEELHNPQPLRLPAGRIHRITAADVKSTQRDAREGTLEYQHGMTKPWERSDIGSYYAQLVDGNHRASAAMLSGESWMPVYVAENSMGDVRKKDLL